VSAACQIVVESIHQTHILHPIKWSFHGQGLGPTSNVSDPCITQIFYKNTNEKKNSDKKTKNTVISVVNELFSDKWLQLQNFSFI
jgi:hypothetical protein